LLFATLLIIILRFHHLLSIVKFFELLRVVLFQLFLQLCSILSNNQQNAYNFNLSNILIQTSLPFNIKNFAIPLMACRHNHHIYTPLLKLRRERKNRSYCKIPFCTLHRYTSPYVCALFGLSQRITL
jgi:hypothetical protein